MRPFILLVLLVLVGVVTADWEDHGYKQVLEPFGFSYQSLDGFHSVDIPYNDEINFEWYFQALQMPRNEKAKLPESYYDFIPIQVGSLQVGGSGMAWEGECFAKLSAVMTCNSTYGSIEITASERRNALCTEWYSFSDRQGSHFKLIAKAGTHTLEFKMRQYEFADVSSHGIGVYLWPLGPAGTAASAAKTVLLFNNPGGFSAMAQANVEFFAEKMEWSMQPRPQNFVNISASEIKSGDMLAILRLDGLDPMIAWGTGGHTGHTAVALWWPDGLYICESTDAEGGNLTYWPPTEGYGIIRTPYNQWMKQAIAANYHVVITRLTPELQAKFDEEKARNWFDSVHGMPYGWHNFMFSFLDVDNGPLPWPITPDLFEVVMGTAERLIPFDSRGSIYNMLIMGLNHRLNTECTTLHCIYQTIDPMNMSLMSACAIPEQDSWKYNGNYSMVCDVFVTEMYKNAGVLDPSYNIQGTEFTPKDLYQAAIWDANWKRPVACQMADPLLPYCQVMGPYVLTLAGYNSIELYKDMNIHCPSFPPVYQRTPGC